MKNEKDMKKPFYASIALHIAVVIVILLDLPFLYSKPAREFKDDLPIMIDLSQLKIAEKTNLPKKIEKKKEVKQEAKKEAKKEDKKEDKTPKVETKPLPPPTPKTQPKKEAKADVKAVETKKADEKKTDKKDEKTEQKKKAFERENDIKTLLASVEKIKVSMKNEPAPESDKGVKDGVVGNYMQDLTISEKDAIAAKMRECWNLDPGARGIGDMLIEVKVALRADGTVAAVKIADTLRYGGDSAFRSVAESARRAVYICGNKGEESPFYLLASRHPDKYEIWQNMVFFFNPLTGGVK